MLQSKGLRISLVGILIFLPSALALLFLPALIATLGILVGGMLVWSGFILTLFTFYSGDQESGEDRR